MHVVQILLPLYDNQGSAFPTGTMAAVRDRLVAKFKGVTAFTRTPAEGIWAPHGTRIRDDVVLVEVMAEELDRAWWAGFRRELEETLRQQVIVIRALPAERL